MRWGITVALCGFLALCGASPANAGEPPDPRPGDVLLGKEGGFAYVSDSETASNPNFTAALASCPQTGGRWRLTGGGLTISGSDPESSFTITVSRPLDMFDLYGDNDTDNDDYWDGSIEAPAGSTLETTAICTKSDALKHKRLDVPDSASGDRSATFRCSKGKVVGGGGFIATSDSFISSMFPADEKRWKLRLFDTGGGAGGMESWVICARGLDVTIRSDRVSVPFAETGTALASCRSGEHVTGGGAMSTGAPDAMSLYASDPIDIGDPDPVPSDGWKASGYNRTIDAVKLKAYAICAG